MTRDWASEPPTNWGEMKAHLSAHGVGCRCREEFLEAVERARARLSRLSGKTCTVCSRFQRLGEYWAEGRNPDGLQRACRTCSSP